MGKVKRLLTGRVGFFAVVLAAFLLGLALRGGAPETDRVGPDAPEAETTIWTCSMHPQIQLPEPGQCPICGMELIPLKSADAGSQGPHALTLSPSARKMAEVTTSLVARRPVEKTLRMVGKLEADETRVREIAAWVPGRIDRMYIDFTGVAVRTGDKLFDLYSPELYSAQEELIQAIKATGQLSQSNLESTRRSATRTIDAVKERLRLWGLSPAQIEDVAKRGIPSDHVTILAPMAGVVLHKGAVEGAYVQTGTMVYEMVDLSVLWLKLDVYESDLSWIRVGQSVSFEAEAFPGEPFEGVVSFVDPTLDERSRSVKVRVIVENPEGKLKPGMFARAVVRAPVTGLDGELPLLIPASAPLVTGKRAVVYVEDPGQPGRYEGREVVLGPQAGDDYVVRAGLSEGERVVSHGNFKIDSALQIQAGNSMMNPADNGPEAAAAVIDASPQFRLQLEDVLGIYLEISAALSQDNLDQAAQASSRLPQSLGAVQGDLLSPAGQVQWIDIDNGLALAAKGISAADDLGQARLAFFDLSARMIQAVRSFGVSDRNPVLVFNCPMAREGAGADWLQSTPDTENPYYGSQMFTCGSPVDTITPGPGAAAGEGPTNR